MASVPVELLGDSDHKQKLPKDEDKLVVEMEKRIQNVTHRCKQECQNYQNETLYYKNMAENVL